MLCSRCRIDKSEDAFHRANAKASGRVSTCKVCVSAYHKERNKCPERKAKQAKQAAGWRHRNPDKVKASREKWRREHPGKVPLSTPYVRAWRAANPGRAYKLYMHSHAGQIAKRVGRALASWADLDKMRAIYVEAGLRNKLGEEVHVDHIVPLRSKIVCGLHVENNLAIVPARANRDKGNQHWPDMP